MSLNNIKITITSSVISKKVQSKVAHQQRNRSHYRNPIVAADGEKRCHALGRETLFTSHSHGSEKQATTGE